MSSPLQLPRDSRAVYEGSPPHAALRRSVGSPHDGSRPPTPDRCATENEKMRDPAELRRTLAWSPGVVTGDSTRGDLVIKIPEGDLDYKIDRKSTRLNSSHAN